MFQKQQNSETIIKNSTLNCKIYLHQVHPREFSYLPITISIGIQSLLHQSQVSQYIAAVCYIYPFMLYRTIVYYVLYETRVIIIRFRNNS